MNQITTYALDALPRAGDEIFPIAQRRLSEVDPPDAEEAEIDFGHAVDEGYMEWATAPAGSPAEKRAALLRLAAAVVAALAVDEAVRGGDAIEAELARLDDDGRLR